MTRPYMMTHFLEAFPKGWLLVVETLGDFEVIIVFGQRLRFWKVSAYVGRSSHGLHLGGTLADE